MDQSRSGRGSLYILMALFGALTQCFAALAYKYPGRGHRALEYSFNLGGHSVLADLSGFRSIRLLAGFIIMGGLISENQEIAGLC